LSIDEEEDRDESGLKLIQEQVQAAKVLHEEEDRDESGLKRSLVFVRGTRP
jgi:hypothetical protein